MNNRLTKPSWIFTLSNTAFMLLIMVLCLYPLMYVVFCSLSTPAALAGHTGLMFAPLGFQIESYKMVFNNPMIIPAFLNTLKIMVMGTTINMLMTMITAYCLSRQNVYFKNIIMYLITFTMIFSGGLIPLYLTVKNIGLLDSHFGVILPTAMTVYNLIVMRTGFAAVPAALEESARIDGANDWTIMWRIVVPLSGATIAVIGLFYGVYHWNSWFNASIFLKNRTKYPLQLILREVLLENATDSMTSGGDNGVNQLYGDVVKYATIVIATVPILCVYPFLQRYFVKGVMIGAIKG